MIITTEQGTDDLLDFCFLGAHVVLQEEDSEGASEAKSCLKGLFRTVL
jgi:hypothetical protein